jgi:hypothetical protein
MQSTPPRQNKGLTQFDDDDDFDPFPPFFFAICYSIRFLPTFNRNCSMELSSYQLNVSHKYVISVEDGRRRRLFRTKEFPETLRFSITRGLRF